MAILGYFALERFNDRIVIVEEIANEVQQNEAAQELRLSNMDQKLIAQDEKILNTLTVLRKFTFI